MLVPGTAAGAFPRTKPMVLGDQYRRQIAAPRLVGVAPQPIGVRLAGDVTTYMLGSESEFTFAS